VSLANDCGAFVYDHRQHRAAVGADTAGLATVQKWALTTRAPRLSPLRQARSTLMDAP
jgi:hypothetical protein